MSDDPFLRLLRRLGKDCACSDAPSEAADRIEALEAALRNAREMVETWAAYASDTMNVEPNRSEDLAEIDAALNSEVKP